MTGSASNLPGASLYSPLLFTLSTSSTFLGWCADEFDLVSTAGEPFLGSGDPVARPHSRLNAEFFDFSSCSRFASTASIITIALAAADIDAGATAVGDFDAARLGIRESELLRPCGVGLPLEGGVEPLSG